MFSSLKVKKYRIYWFGMFLSLVGTWIQSVAQSWLVFDLTNSAFLLGVVGFLSSIPMFLLSLFGGVVADRVNKRKILIFTQTAFMFLAFLLAVLTQANLITATQIMFIALLNGIVMSFDAPTRQAVVVELVGKKHLFNAIALNSVAFNSSRIIGPALAGILVSSIGMSGCFYINGVSFFAVLIALMLIQIDDRPRPNKNNSALGDLKEGLLFIKNNRLILILITIVGISSLFGMPYVILMPVFAKELLHVGVKGLGLLMSSAGAGALVAGLVLAHLGDFKHKGRLLIISSIIFSISLMLFSLSRNFIFSLFALALIGCFSVMAMALINTLLQTIVEDEYRGRIMSVFMFTFAGFMPFGNLLAGSISQIAGVSMTVLFSGIICMVSFLIITISYPELRKA
ncbi:MAG: MFS transporter [Candidatus Omnitrophica bacterium]|nr:MFS transporter [Candidatus Omnitrophota bacterium]